MPLADLELLLRQAYAFSVFTPAELRRLAGEFTEHHYESGDTIARRGEPADGWSLVYAGKARALPSADSSPAAPVLFAKGEGFGERSLIDQHAWPHTIRAEGSVTLLTLPAPAFERFAAGLPPGQRESCRQRLLLQEDFDFLRRLRVFAHLTPPETERMFERLERISLGCGTFLFHEDAPSDRCYIIRRGRIRLLKAVDQSKRQLATRREGDLLGEIELLYGTPRMADAVADTDAELFALGKDLFDELTPNDDARAVLYQLATDRLLQYQNMLSEVDARFGQETLPSLSVRWIKIPGRFIARSYPFVPAESPLAAGLACLAMVDTVHKRNGAWQDHLEKLLWDRQPDTILTLSRKAEQCGYLSRLLNVGVESLPGLPLPAIVEDEGGAPAVLFHADRHRVVVANPRGTLRTIDAASFAERWTGRLLTLTPAERNPSRGLLRAYAPYLAGIGVVSFIIQLFGLGGPLANMWIVDRVLVDAEWSLFRLLLLGMLVLLAFRGLAGALREYLLAHVSRRITLALQLRFLDHILRLPQSVAASLQTGDFAVRFHENETFVRLAFKAGLQSIVDGLTLAACLLALAAISLPLAGVALVFVAAYAAVVLASSPFLRRLGRRNLETREAVESHLIETISGIQTIKALVLEPSFFTRGGKLMARQQADDFHAARLRANIELAGSILHTAAIIAILGYGAVLTLNAQATTGGMVASLGIFGATLVPLNGLIGTRDVIRGARASLASVQAVLDLGTEESGTTTVAPMVKGHVVLKNISFRYPGTAEDVLTDVTLEVLPGQKVALVGRSGSGKTTLFNLLMGLYQPTRGTIHLDQIDINTIPKSALRRQIGMVEQHPFLFEGTVRDNIAKADPTAPFDRVVKAAAMAGAHEFIEALPLGYDTPLGERGATLSGGEKQRLLIARALVTSPSMLLFDEATSAVDTSAERAIHGNIDAIQAGRTFFLITHRLHMVRRADLIVVLDQGRIVETGSHATLMARRGLYYYLNTHAV